MTRFAEDSWNPAVNITTWWLLSATILCVLCRLTTKWLIIRKLTKDDVLIILSLTFCVGNTIAISIATANGYGDHTYMATMAQQDAVMKAQFAAILLFILSILLSKLSMTCLIRSLTPAKKDHIIAHIVQGLMVMTGVIAFFGWAFRCRFPRTWDYMNEKCVSVFFWAIYIAVTNIITDILIIIQAILLIFNIQATLKKKALFASIFFPRFFVVAATLCQLILDLQHGPYTDPFIETSACTICMEVIQSLSIITACWAQLKPFLERIRSNAFRLQGMDSSKHFTSMGSRTPHSQLRSTISGRRPSTQEFASSSLHNTRTLVSAGEAATWDAESQSSQTHIIRETRTFSVMEMQADSSL